MQIHVKIYICTGITHVFNVLIGFVTCRYVKNRIVFIGLKSLLHSTNMKKNEQIQRIYAPRNLIVLF